MAQPPSNGQTPWVALAVTNLIKLGGLVLGMHAGFAHQPDYRVLAMAAFMMAGGQGLEGLAKRFFGAGE